MRDADRGDDEVHRDLQLPRLSTNELLARQPLAAVTRTRSRMHRLLPVPSSCGRIRWTR